MAGNWADTAAAAAKKPLLLLKMVLLLLSKMAGKGSVVASKKDMHNEKTCIMPNKKIKQIISIISLLKILKKVVRQLVRGGNYDRISLFVCFLFVRPYIILF